ncbi:hypothetical protein C8R44DRAFT_742209 [Mycena epipterygia]|nr:hypothetical protein C8R44DRAFT_742209 [Mycena epipterygia]
MCVIKRLVFGWKLRVGVAGVNTAWRCCGPLERANQRRIDGSDQRPRLTPRRVASNVGPLLSDELSSRGPVAETESNYSQSLVLATPFRNVAFLLQYGAVRVKQREKTVPQVQNLIQKESNKFKKGSKKWQL